jgi:protein arginine N-methyltransferase 5
MTDYIQIAIHIPVYGYEEAKETAGDLMSFARNRQSITAKANKEIDLFETWDAWNLIRSVCKYNSTRGYTFTAGKRKRNRLADSVKGVLCV